MPSKAKASFVLSIIGRPKAQWIVRMANVTFRFFGLDDWLIIPAVVNSLSITANVILQLIATIVIWARVFFCYAQWNKVWLVYEPAFGSPPGVYDLCSLILSFR